MRFIPDRHKKTFVLTLMLLPGAIWFLVLRYVPMAGIVIAFKNYRPYPRNPTLINNIIHSDWVGLKNFEFIFHSSDAWRMIRNTLAYNLVFIILGLIISVAFAVLLSELTKRFMAKLYQTVMFFPFFVSWVVVSYFVFAFLGPTFGLLSDIANWYMEPKWWPVILTSANLWKSIGYSTILYLAAITGIDPGQYEAAAIDGASKWQQVWHITLPNIKPMIIILLILNLGRIFSADFGLFYNVPMDSGPLYPVTDVIDTYIYRALQKLTLGMTTAAGLLQNVVGFVLIMATNMIVRKLDRGNALF